jgi:PAS domain S-box-containing protein
MSLVPAATIEEVLKRGFDLCLDMVCLANFDGYFTLLNRVWEDELGYSREELLSRPYLEFVHPDDRNRTATEASRLDGGEHTWMFENRYRRSDGAYIWLSWRATPLSGHDLIMAVARNITRQKEKEEEAAREAQETKRTLENLVRNLPGMAYRCRNDDDYTMEALSHGCQTLTGYRAEDLLENHRMSYADLIHLDDLEVVRTAVDEGVAAKLPYRVNYRIRTKSGDERWVWEQGCGVYSDAGELQFLEGYIADVTAERSAEQRLREQAMLLEEANDAISVRGLDHVVTYWNKGAERLWGWSGDEAIGRNVAELLGHEDDAGFRTAFESTMKDGRWSGELRQVTRDGREIVVAARWTLIRSPEGRPQSILSLAEDQTDRKILEGQILRAQRLESIGTLASGIAHDLNNTLSPVLMGVELLRRQCGPEAAGTIDIIENCANRGSRLVKQVLTFGKGIEGDRVVTNLRHIVRNVAEITVQTFPDSIVLKQECPRDLWPVAADPVQLEQVFMNLLVNARDAMPDGGTLRVRGQNIVLDETYARMHLEARPGPHVLVEVADTGCGIPPRFLNRVFEPFFTTKEPGVGTGLGLATVHSIVHSHGGFINLYSELGKGTSFKVYLPASESERLQSETAEDRAPGGRGELVLVVDDDTPVREMARVVLEASGYRAELAANGAEAVARYARGGVDAVVLDWSMPVMNGSATITALRSLSPEAPILVASGLADRNELQAIAPAPPFIGKPFTADQLLRELAALLGRGDEVAG